MVISLLDTDIVKHFLITETDENGFKLEGPTFNSVGDLMDYHQRHELPLTSKSGCVVKNPILKETWELMPQDIELKDKIGKG